MASERAVVCKVEEIKEHPNADRLRLASIFGYTVIVGTDVKVGDTGVLFLPDAVLTGTFIDHNKELATYLAKNRVRAVKLRGVVSEGFYIPKSAFLHIDDLVWKPGTVIGERQDIWYQFQVQRNQHTNPNNLNGKGERIGTVGAYPQFPKHKDTSQIRLKLKHIHDLFDQGYVGYISLKYHGTSQRSGLVETPADKPIWYRPVRRVAQYLRKLRQFNAWFTDWRWEHAVVKPVAGSRNVVLKTIGESYRAFAHDMVMEDLIQGNEGVVVFYEIVGYNMNGKGIMQPYTGGGTAQHYDYGTHPIDHPFDVYVYAITVEGRYLSPVAVTEYVQINSKRIKTPLRMGVLPSYKNFEETYEDIAAKVELGDYNNGSYNHIDEGYVLAMHNHDTRDTKFFKFKTSSFYIQEGKLKSPDIT